MRVFDPDKAARALLDAAVNGDASAAKKHKVSRETLRLWRIKAQKDPVLWHNLENRKAMIDQKWGEDLDEALALNLDFLKRAAIAADPADPDAIKAITDSVKALADIRLTVRMIDAGDASPVGKPAQGPRQVPRLAR